MRYFNFSYRLVIAASAVILVLLGIACGESAPTVQEISLKVEPEEQKSIYIDNFLNLTENEQLNIFEEGIPEMLASSLAGVRSIIVMPRDTILKLQAVSLGPPEQNDIVTMAKKQGAKYVMDGWIAKGGKDSYRIYANLLNLQTNKMQHKFSVVEFTNKDDALTKISEMISDIQEKLSQPQSEFETIGQQVASNYNAYRYYMKALQSYQRGEPEIAAALMEQHIKMVEEDYEKSDDKENYPIKSLYYARLMASHYYYMVGEEERSRKHAAILYNERDKLPKELRIIVEAFWDELNGRYQDAWDKYDLVKKELANDKDYYLRKSKLAIKLGKGPEYAIKVLKEGLKQFPNEASLRKAVAELEMEIEGDAAVSRYAAEAAKKKDDPVSSEVASALVTIKLDDKILGEIPQLIPTVRIESQPSPTNGSVSVGKLAFKFGEFETGIDFSCPVTMDHIAELASRAVKEGNAEIAYELAKLIEEKGKAQNTKDVYHRIMATVSLINGDFQEAQKQALMISEKDPQHFITLGTIKMWLGQHEEAASIMEKALKLADPSKPQVYYDIAKAYLLAGDYKKWNDYNKKFLAESEKLKLIPKAPKAPDPKEN